MSSLKILVKLKKKVNKIKYITVQHSDFKQQIDHGNNFFDEILNCFDNARMKVSKRQQENNS